MKSTHIANDRRGLTSAVCRRQTPSAAWTSAVRLTLFSFCRFWLIMMSSAWIAKTQERTRLSRMNGYGSRAFVAMIWNCLYIFLKSCSGNDMTVTTVWLLFPAKHQKPVCLVFSMVLQQFRIGWHSRRKPHTPWKRSIIRWCLKTPAVGISSAELYPYVKCKT